MNKFRLFILLVILFFSVSANAAPFLVYPSQISPIEYYNFEVNGIEQQVPPITLLDGDGFQLIIDLETWGTGVFTVRARAKYANWPMLTMWTNPFIFEIPNTESIGIPEITVTT